MPGAYTARIYKGLLELISPKIATTWSVKMISSAAIPQVKPKVSARNGKRVFVLIVYSPFMNNLSLQF